MRPRAASIAKVRAPRLFGVAPRERLTSLLQDNRGRPLIWIEGPPGAGKTTLVASFLEAQEVPCLWYQVDSGDVDPASVFFHLTLAAAAAGGEGDVPLPAMAPEHGADIPGFARLYFRILYASLPAGVVIVFDNCHEAAGSAEFLDILGAAASQAPPESSVVCTSRGDVPGPFAVLLGSSALLPLRWDSLRLTLDETRAIAAARGVSDEHIVLDLHVRSEGWAAGLTLMLERASLGGTEAGSMAAETREAIFHYFATLLFERASAETRHVLLRVALLPRITATAAAALSGQADAAGVLEHLCRRRLFVERRHGEEPVYQLHALLREFLQNRLRLECGRDAVADLERHSAALLEAEGSLEAAFDLHVRREDWTDARRLIADCASELLITGRWQSLERWVEAVPEDLREADPLLLYWWGVARMSVDPESGIALLEQARGRFEAQDQRRGVILCLTRLLNGSRPGYAGMAKEGGWIDAMLTVIDDVPNLLPPDDRMLAWSGLLTSLVYARPWHELIPVLAHRIVTLFGTVEDRRARMSAACCVLAALTMTCDSFEAGESIVAASADLLDHPEINPSDSIWLRQVRGYFRFVQARYEEAWADIDAACALARRFGLTERFPEPLMFRFMIEFRIHAWSAAEATWREFKALPAPRRHMARAMEAIYEARIAQHHGRFGEGADHALRSLRLLREIDTVQQQAVFGVFAADSLMHAGRLGEAGEVLADARALVERSPSLDAWRGAVALCEAYLAHLRDPPEVARSALAAALAVAGTGNRRYFLRYLECAMPPLFCAALAQGLEIDLVVSLVRMFRLPAPEGAPEAWPRAVTVRTLGVFEIRVRGEPLAFSRKPPLKVLALLKGLLAHGGREVPEAVLCDTLWRDEEGDAGRQALSITVLRLRKLLGSSEAVGHLGGKVWLDPRQCWVDAWRFEARIAEPGQPRDLEHALSLYQGDFLAGDASEPWTVAYRERLRGKFTAMLGAAGLALETTGDHARALSLYQRGIDADPIVEPFHRGLMRCYRALDRPTEAVSAFRRLRSVLSVTLGVLPSAESETLCRDILGAMSGGTASP